MREQSAEVCLLAKALYEIRILLAPYLGSESDASTNVRVAAHIAHALHNEALAVASGKRFDLTDAIKKVEAIDDILSGSDGSRLVRLWQVEPNS